MRYDLADIGAILTHHDNDRPGYRIGDGILFDRLADALGVKGGTIYGLLADARAILATDEGDRLTVTFRDNRPTGSRLK